MSRLIKKISGIFVQPAVKFYLQKDRTYSYKGMRLLIRKGVFHPAFFFSTRLLLSQLEKENLPGKQLLELGAGSGLISLFAAKAGAVVTASDINPVAVEGVLHNSRMNNVNIRVLESDLFTQIPAEVFHYIIINPPYYRGEAKTVEEQAWFAGKDLEYFSRLFSTIAPYFNADSHVLLSLCEGCELSSIKHIARHYGFQLHLLETKRKWQEDNYIFRLLPASPSAL